MNRLVRWPISRFYENKGLLYVTTANVVAAGLSATLWLIFAGILSPSQYGQANYYIAVGALGSVLGTFGFNTLNITRIAKKIEIGNDGMYFFIFIIGIIVSCIVSIATQSGLTGLLSFSMVAFNMSTSIPLGNGQYDKYMKMVITARSLLIILALFFYLLIGLDGILLGYGASSLIFGYTYFKKLLRTKPTLNGVTKSSIKFSFHSFVMNFAQSSNIFIDKILIAPLFGFQLLGLYQISTQFLMILAIIPSSLFLYLLPKEASGRSNIRLSLYALIFSVFFSFLLFFTSDFILQNLFPRYIDAGELVKIIAFGGVPMTIIAGSNSRLLGMEKSILVFIGAIIFLLALFSSLLLLKSVFGNSGVAIALVGSLSAQAAFLVVAEKVQHPKDIFRAI